MGATTMEEYTRYIEGDAALKRGFESIHVRDETLCAFISAFYLSERYLRKLQLPDKAGSRTQMLGRALVTLDKAGARTQMLGRALVTSSDFEHVVSTPTEILVGLLEHVMSTPTGILVGLLKIEDTFKFSLIGQEEALAVLSGALLRAHTGVKDETKPIGCFLFAGPTGLGKKEMAKLYAEVYFGCEEAMVRLDMGEYMDCHSVSRLIGSPHEDGGQLAEAVRRRPHCLVLFNEIEKAHQQVWDVVLEILDEGRLTDGKGKTVDFSNTIVILTLNVEREKKLEDAFKEELLEKFDQVLMFKPMRKDTIQIILEILICEEFATVAANENIKVRVSKGLKEKLVSEGCDKRYGARALQRAMARLVEDKLAQEILNGIVAEQDSIIIKLADETVAEQDCEAMVEIGLGMSKTDLMAEQDCEVVVEIRLGVSKMDLKPNNRTEPLVFGWFDLVLNCFGFGSVWTRDEQNQFETK